MNPIEEGPYYLLACKPAVHYTMGGLRIDLLPRFSTPTAIQSAACTPQAK